MLHIPVKVLTMKITTGRRGGAQGSQIQDLCTERGPHTQAMGGNFMGVLWVVGFHRA